MWFLLAAGVAALIYFDPVGHRARSTTARGSGDSAAVSRPDAAVASDGSTGVPGDAQTDAPAPIDAPLDSPPPQPLYTIPEALDELGASPLKFIGTGEWFGNASIHACAYRNDRVLVVNVYCTRKETPALGLVVLSPTRGRVMIYVEDDAAISTLKRSDYQTFRAEVQPPLEGDAPRLDFTFAELNAWEERRYHADQGACWFESGNGDCSERLGTTQLETWGETAKPFLADPPERWYQLTKDLHARAVKDLRSK